MMWKVDGGLVQVECGSMVIEDYTAKTFLGIGKEAGNLLLSETEKLRTKIGQKGGYLPRIHYTDNSKLPANEYRIYFGLEKSITLDHRKIPLMSALEQLSDSMQIPEMTKEYVESMFLESVKKMVEKKYNDAHALSRKIYYWAILLEMREIAVNAVINLAGICLINNYMEEGLRYAQRAAVLAEEKENYDPELKYYAHRCFAEVSWICKRGPDAAGGFLKALEDLQFQNEPELKAQLYWDLAVVWSRMEEYGRAIQAMDKLYETVKENKLYSQDFLRLLLEYSTSLRDKRINQLENYNAEINRILLQKIRQSSIQPQKTEINKIYYGVLISATLGILSKNGLIDIKIVKKYSQ